MRMQTQIVFSIFPKCSPVYFGGHDTNMTFFQQNFEVTVYNNNNDDKQRSNTLGETSWGGASCNGYFVALIISKT